MKGRNAASKCMAGSIPPECRKLWDYARQMGYNTDLLYRVDSGDGVQKEQAVDELLHLKISDALLDFEATQTLIILTGDGKVSDYGTSFENRLFGHFHFSNWKRCFSVNRQKYFVLT